MGQYAIVPNVLGGASFRARDDGPELITYVKKNPG